MRLRNYKSACIKLSLSLPLFTLFFCLSFSLHHNQHLSYFFFLLLSTSLFLTCLSLSLALFVNLMIPFVSLGQFANPDQLTGKECKCLYSCYRYVLANADRWEEKERNKKWRNFCLLFSLRKFSQGLQTLFLIKLMIPHDNQGNHDCNYIFCNHNQN